MLNSLNNFHKKITAHFKTLCTNTIRFRRFLVTALKSVSVKRTIFGAQSSVLNSFFSLTVSSYVTENTVYLDYRNSFFLLNAYLTENTVAIMKTINESRPTRTVLLLLLLLLLLLYSGKNYKYKVWYCMHRASSHNMYIHPQDAQNSCDYTSFSTIFYTCFGQY
jgi:hypothetical protein